MKATSYAVLVAMFVVGATFVRVYGANNQYLMFLSPGVERGVPVKIVEFWVMMAIAIAVAIFGLFRRRHPR